MGRYIIRRLIGVVTLVFIVMTLTFGIFFLVPASPATLACGKSCSPERIADINVKLGLDKPIHEQYGSYVKGFFVGRDFADGTVQCDAPCFGVSFQTDEDVLRDLLLDRLPITVSIAIGAAILWLLIGTTVGVISALKKGTGIDKSAMALALGGVSLPVYLTALVISTIICGRLGWFEYPKYNDFSESPIAWAQGLALPWLVLAFLYAALYARITRANMIETMGEDYIRTARAKGLKERTVVGKHGLRAALTPIVTIFGLDLGALLGGAVLTESAFGLNGVGKLAIDAIGSVDLPVILGVTVFSAFFIVFANFVVDIVYAVIDPKVRLA
ncbi:MAG: ABC transporter permease [Mycobacteriales bacterium]|nr:ABC transporter permease [Mycobacteriales bacterium]